MELADLLRRRFSGVHVRPFQPIGAARLYERKVFGRKLFRIAINCCAIAGWNPLARTGDVSAEARHTDLCASGTQSVTDTPTPRAGLLHQVSRAVFWNTALLPLVSVAGILLSVLVRRSFGLESGYYDAALGIANSILFYTSLGLSGSLPKFIPELQLTAGRHAAMQLIVRLGTIRLAVVGAVVLVVNVWAEPLAAMLDLGSNGPAYLRLLSALLIGRAALDFAYRALDSFFQQVSVNTLSLIHGLLDLALVALVVLLGLGMTGVIAALGASAVVMAIVASVVGRAAPRHAPTGRRARARLGRFAIARLEALGRHVCSGSVALLRNTRVREPGPHENPGRS